MSVKTIKKNITFILGISIPILMILFVAGSIYLPSIFVQPPKFNFLYSNDDIPYNESLYRVQDGRLVENQIENGNYNYPNGKPELFIYYVVKNESKQISFEEAQKLNLDPSNISPDGFEFVYGGGNPGIFPFLFYSGDNYDARYLKGHNISKKLNIQLNGSSYYNSRFIGWIKN